MDAMKRAAGVAILAAVLTQAAAAQDASGSDDVLLQANNPLASFNTFNLQDQYNGSLTELDGESSNSFFLRGAFPLRALGGDWLVRATLPINTVPNLAGGGDINALGDFNIFAAYMIDTGRPSLSFAIGPQLTAPTATEDGTGSGKWSLGLANVLFDYSNPKFQWGYLLTWQASVAGDSDREDVNAGAFQPFLIRQLGDGWYLRSTAIWTYDFESDAYNIPLGLGLGKAIKTERAIVNVFAEPQASVVSRGAGLAEWGVFAGVNFQFPK